MKFQEPDEESFTNDNYSLIIQVLDSTKILQKLPQKISFKNIVAQALRFPHFCRRRRRRCDTRSTFSPRSLTFVPLKRSLSLPLPPHVPANAAPPPSHPTPSPLRPTDFHLR